ncbi:MULTISPECIES: hypothetical protein [Vibrio]|uniref:hypothetical protein n=1 Tax=Vibrio TaxID=662 RepID=UPI0004DF79DE|nr:hypothetical protein [Vibrio parahaemolyticus]EHD1698135.1 hypothetical protein [Vibrio vulnificus]EKZ9225864.1 hypothetical protein [Vibrio vulnificus]ELC9582706.1 hypothetical protein [Vibrio vulnificus]MCU8149757.1 hypothetical protein [Vibrio vulnificus]MCU8385814.1 hypothetical protein [Vibrio vulnificus]
MKLDKVTLLIVWLAFGLSNGQANAEGEAWTLELNDTCDSFRLELPLPAINASCNLDTRSGNPSKWFNPLETCSLDFDMIGLPTMGDIAAGVAGSVCEAIKDVKDQTIDKIIDDVNASIPDNIGGNQNGNNSNGNDNSWQKPDVAQPEEGSNHCYTTDASGSTIVVPCDIAKPQTTDLNKCYVKSNNYSNPFTPIQCNRFSEEKEICIERYEMDHESRELYPILAQCTTALKAIQAEACENENEKITYCRDLGRTPTQTDRQCRFYRELDNGRVESYIADCYGVEKACYGHLNGLFQAATCQQFHDQFFRNNNVQGVFDDFWSFNRNNRESIDG